MDERQEQVQECWVSLIGGVLSMWHEEEGPYPYIVPCAGLVLLVNDVRYNYDAVVMLGDKIVIEPVLEEHPGTWSVQVSADGLKAAVQSEPRVLIKRTLLDIPPSPKLELKVAEVIERSSPIQLDRLMSALRQEGITVGVDLTALSTIVAAEEAATFTIARGTPPTPGTDAQVEILFDLEDRRQREVRPDANVDFRTRFEYSSVREGQVLVRKIPLVPAIEGISVRGEPVFAQEPMDFELVAGTGVRLNEQADKLIAVNSGRPLVKQRQRSVRVDIRPDMIVSGDVDLRSGNVTFVGDVTIQGDVTAGFTVWAGGNVKVRGLVENSHVQAFAGAEVQGNVISSQVLVGPPPGLSRTFSPLLRELEKDIRSVQTVIEQLKKRIPSDKQSFAGKLVSTLIEQRLVGFNERVTSLHRELLKLDRRLHSFFGVNVATILAKFLDEMKSGPKTESHLLELLVAIGTLQSRLEEISAQNAHITARNVINSTLVSTGEISVINGGCYNSYLQAGGKVVVQGVVRGGEIKAGSDVVVRELGSEAGVSTQINVTSTAKVFIGTAWEHSLVIIGFRSYRFETKRTGVVLYLEGDNLIVK